MRTCVDEIELASPEASVTEVHTARQYNAATSNQRKVLCSAHVFGEHSFLQPALLLLHSQAVKTHVVMLQNRQHVV